MQETEQTAIVLVHTPAIITLPTAYRYGDDLTLAGLAADHASRIDAFAEYHAEQANNTRTAQLDALKCFSIYLAEAGIKREADDLYQDAKPGGACLSVCSRASARGFWNRGTPSVHSTIALPSSGSTAAWPTPQGRFPMRRWNCCWP